MRESRGLMGLAAPAMGYDGMVQTPQGQVRVEDGVLSLGKRKLNVSKDGIVTDEQDKPVAKVVNGQLAPIQQQAQQVQPQPAQGMG